MLQKPISEDIKLIFGKQQTKSIGLRTEPISVRKTRLKRLEQWIHTNRERIKAAVHSDFRKPMLEVDTSEIYPVLTELRHTLTHLETWARPKKIDATLTYLGTFSELRYEPKGTCLIIAPWNFPFNLCVGPLVSCLAAGNTAVIKPSELTPHTSALIREMISEIFEMDVVTVVEGGVEVTQSLLSLPFDHIFFTGSPAVGKVVMKAAAANLSSVTLELGGKSPTIIDASANLKDAARRIAFGKFFNNGQTCIAPDYVMIEKSVKDEFIQILKAQIEKTFGQGRPVDENSPDYARIVNRRHFDRLKGLLDDAIGKGAKPVLSGPLNEETHFIPPVMLTDIPVDSRITEEEIFGPILPLFSFERKEEVVDYINAMPKPLALYIFTSRRSFSNFVLSSTSAGSACINECVLQFAHPNLPFGGVNNSGIGKSHGYFGFQAFSNEKPVLRQKSGWATPYLLHPPYTAGMKKIVDLLLRWF